MIVFDFGTVGCNITFFFFFFLRNNNLLIFVFSIGSFVPASPTTLTAGAAYGLSASYQTEQEAQGSRNQEEEEEEGGAIGKGGGGEGGGGSIGEAVNNNSQYNPVPNRCLWIEAR